MRKTWKLFMILVLFILFGCFLFSEQNRRVQFQIVQAEEQCNLALSLKTDSSNEILYSWFDEIDEIAYFFLPSFVLDNDIYCDLLESGTVSIDHVPLSKHGRFTWESNIPYTVTCNGKDYTVAFMKSANLHSLFMQTESGSMDYVNADKNNREQGELDIVASAGNLEYSGKMKRISARGNSTFAVDKKSYTIVLDKASPLCGLESGKKWNLLALYYEYDKMHTKLIYEMADYLGMEYNPECIWIDLYCNGEYQGIYLLIEAITVADGRVEIYDLEKENEKTERPADISGGYLLEREDVGRLEEGEVYFTTSCGYYFALKSPGQPTENELDYIQSYVQNIENMFVAGDTSYQEYLDLDSFAKQFLLDKLTLNPDSMWMSTFYYKDRNSDILKVGPLWDYDRAMGTSLPNYNLSIGDYPNSMSEWYVPLYSEPMFFNKLIAYYERLLPLLEDILDHKIDAYASLLADAVAMDATRRPLETVQCDCMSYMEYDSYVRYLKYFLANRINYLNETWQIDYPTLSYPSSTGDMHTVRFFAEDGTLLESRSVMDGDCILDLPSLDTEVYSGWQFFQTSKLYYNTMQPVYEDLDFYRDLRFESPEEEVEYQLKQIEDETSLETWLALLKNTNVSVCVYIPADSTLYGKKEFLMALKELCAYVEPEKLNMAADFNRDYFLIIDNGWQSIWESVNGEALLELSTTFGPVSYETDKNGTRHIYIQNREKDYLADTKAGIDVQFIVINRLTGEVSGTAEFANSTRIDVPESIFQESPK